MRTELFSLLILVAVLGCCNCTYSFTAWSVKSGFYDPIRNHGAQVVTVNQCDKDVSEPRGILEHSFSKADAQSHSTCIWRIHAPANHVVNVLRVYFGIEDDPEAENYEDYDKCSIISLYDGKEPAKRELLTQYVVSLREKVGYFIQSQSYGRDMTVEIAYSNKIYNTQKMSVEYEFLDNDKIAALQKSLASN